MRQILPMRFALAERLDWNAVRAQAQVLKGNPMAPVLDAVSDFVLILNHCRQILFINRSIRDLLRLEGMDSVIGLRPGEMLRCEHAFTAAGGCGLSDHCRACGAVLAVLAGFRGPAEEECRITARSGDGVLEAYEFKVRAMPLTVDDTSLLLLCLTDISSAKRRYALERIFFHDILNAAGGVRGLAECLREEAPSELAPSVDELISYLSQMIEEITAQKELLAAEHDELNTQESALLASYVAQNVRSMYLAHRTAQDKSLVVDPLSQDGSFVSDYRLVRRILGNMVINALEATPPGGVVSIGYAVDAGGVRFMVRNPGCIPEEARLRIFQRSYSSKGPDRGLGTYSIRLLAERYLRGTVSFSSSLEQGTEFAVALPLHPDRGIAGE